MRKKASILEPELTGSPAALIPSLDHSTTYTKYSYLLLQHQLNQFQLQLPHQPWNKHILMYYTSISSVVPLHTTQPVLPYKTA